MSYTGTVVRLPIGATGFSGARNPTQLNPTNFAAVDGLTLEGGLIQKEGGATKLNATALGAPSSILAGISYSPAASLWRDAVFLSNGSILKDTGSGTFGVTLRSGLNAPVEPPPVFAMAGGEGTGSPRTLFCFSSSNQVQAVDGDGNTMADISSPAADWTGAGNFPTFGIVHDGRVWAGGNASDPHRIYYSDFDDHQNFSTGAAGTLSVFPGEGEKLVGAISFKSLLVLFKFPRGIYVVNTQDPDTAAWRIDSISSAVGSLNQNTIVAIDNDVLYMDVSGNIHMLSATSAFGGLQTSNMSQVADIADFMRLNTNQENLQRACGVWNGEKQTAIFAFPGLAETDNNIRLSIDFSAPQVGPRFLTSYRDTPISMWMRQVNNVFKPVHGDDAGFVWLMDQDARNKGGAAYEFSFETPNMDLSHMDPRLATMDKSGDFLEIVYEPQGDWEIEVIVSWDDVPGPPLLFPMGSSGAVLGSFVLGTDVLSSEAIRSSRKRIAGSGRRLKISVLQDGLNENVAISDFYLSFRTTDERSR